MTASTGRSSSQCGRDGVPAQRVTLDEHAPVDEPAGRRPDPGGVGPATDRLEAAPVERQGREVEQVEEGLGRPLDDGPALPLELVVRKVDEVEVGGTEPEPVPPLGDDDLLLRERHAGLVHHGHGGLGGAMATDLVGDGHGSSCANPAGSCRASCEDRGMTAPVLSTRVLNRTLLARQHLLARATMPALAMIEHLAGMQAQEPKDPYVALWSRLEGFQPAELESLLVERLAVRSVLMRSTVHLASIDDALAFRPVVQPVLDWELFRNKTWSVGLQGVDLGPVLDLGRRLMEKQPRSLAELRVAMADASPTGTRRPCLRLPGPAADACRSRRVACGRRAAR